MFWFASHVSRCFLLFLRLIFVFFCCLLREELHCYGPMDQHRLSFQNFIHFYTFIHIFIQVYTK